MEEEVKDLEPEIIKLVNDNFYELLMTTEAKETTMEQRAEKFRVDHDVTTDVLGWEWDEPLAIQFAKAELLRARREIKDKMHDKGVIFNTVEDAQEFYLILHSVLGEIK